MAHLDALSEPASAELLAGPRCPPLASGREVRVFLGSLLI
jgi:hypothetical protein